MAHQQNPQLTQAQAKRAIFLEIENEKPWWKAKLAPSPVLAGVIVDGEYSATVLDTRLAQVLPVSGFEIAAPAEVLERVKQRARDEERVIVHWASTGAISSDDHRRPFGDLSFDLRAQVEPHFEGPFAATQFARSMRGPLSLTNTRRVHGLRLFCASKYGFRIPSKHGFGMARHWVRQIRSDAGMNSSFAEWSAGGQEAWARLVAHNRLTIEAMIVLMGHHGARDS